MRVWSRLKVRLFLSHRTARHKGRVLAEAVWTGLWLGALSREDLCAIDERHYSGQALYQGEEYNRSGLMDWEEKAMATFPSSGSLLVVGAGGGREVLALDARGFCVEGFECHPEMVRFAQSFLPRQGCASPVRLIARDAAPREGGPYDGAIVGWGAYMLIPGRARRVRFLREIRARVRPGAPVLLSFFSRTGDSARLKIAARIGTAVRRIRRAEPVEVGDLLRPNFAHRFIQPEIAREMAAAGFEMACFHPQGPGPRDSGWAVGHAVPEVPDHTATST